MVLDPEPPVMGLGLNVALAPEGSPLALIVTFPVKPPEGVTVFQIRDLVVGQNYREHEPIHRDRPCIAESQTCAISERDEAAAEFFWLARARVYRTRGH